MFILGIIVMVSVSVASHMGLNDAVASTVSKIIKCPRCCTFWSTLILMSLLDNGILESVVVALGAAYLGYWFGLLLTMMTYLYDDVWQRVNQRKKGRNHHRR